MTFLGGHELHRVHTAFRRSVATLCCLATAAMSGTGAQWVQAAPTTPEPEVRFAQNLEFTDALRVLARSARRTVVAPASQPGKVEGLPFPVPLSEALGQISAACDVYWRSRPDVIVFNRRFATPQTPLEMEVAEYRAIARELLALYRPLSPYKSDDLQVSRNQNRFFNTLTIPQLVAMRSPEGLPFLALPRPQQAEWLTINAAAVYSDPVVYLERAARLFGGWDQCRIRRTRPEYGRGWTLDYNAAPGTSDTGELILQQPGTFDGGALPPKPDTAGGEVVSTQTARLPAPLNSPAPPLEGEFTVEAMVQKLGAAGSLQIRAPEWARQQKLIVVTAPGATLGQVLQGLADLKGWNLTEPSKGIWALDRPVMPAQVRAPRAVHSLARASLGPDLQLYLRRTREVSGLTLVRYRDRFSKLDPEVRARAQAGDGSVPVTDLSPEHQRVLAEMALYKLLFNHIKRYGDQPEPPWHVVEPEKGRFVLEGEGKHPFLGFEVPRPDGRVSRWGWVVGSGGIIIPPKK